METLFGIAIIAGIGWLLFKGGERKAKAEQTQIQRQAPMSPAVEANNDEETSEIAKARAASERAWERERSAIDEHHAAMSGDLAKIEAACKIVSEAELDSVLPSLWGKARDWPSWVNLPDRWTPLPGIGDISGSKDGKVEKVAWTWQGAQYEFTFTQKTNYTFDDDYDPAELSLTYNGTTVITLSCQQHHSEYGSNLTYSDTEALSVGAWMAELIELEATLEAESNASMRETLAEMDRERASRMNLGE